MHFNGSFNFLRCTRKGTWTVLDIGCTNKEDYHYNMFKKYQNLFFQNAPLLFPDFNVLSAIITESPHAVSHFILTINLLDIFTTSLMFYWKGFVFSWNIYQTLILSTIKNLTLIYYIFMQKIPFCIFHINCFHIMHSHQQFIFSQVVTKEGPLHSIIFMIVKQ